MSTSGEDNPPTIANEETILLKKSATKFPLDKLVKLVAEKLKHSWANPVCPPADTSYKGKNYIQQTVTITPFSHPTPCPPTHTSSRHLHIHTHNMAYTAQIDVDTISDITSIYIFNPFVRDPTIFYPPINVDFSFLTHPTETTGNLILDHNYGLDVDSLVFTTTPHTIIQKGTIVQLCNQPNVRYIKDHIVLFKYCFTVLCESLPYYLKIDICKPASEFSPLIRPSHNRRLFCASSGYISCENILRTLHNCGVIIMLYGMKVEASDLQHYDEIIESYKKN